MSAWLAHLRYFAADAADEWRHSPGPNGLAMATMAAALFVAAGSLLALANLSAHVGRWKDDLRVSVYLKDGALDEEVAALRAALAAVPGVERVERVGKDEALERFRRAFPDLADVAADLGSNPLPASLEVLLAPGASSPAAAEAVEATASGRPPVDEIRYDRGLLDRVDALLDVARWGGAAVGLIVFTAVGLVVAGVLRLTVYARRDEIEIMQLVGASPLFVRGPFLVAGLAQGLAGGVFALVLVEAARRLAMSQVGGGREGLLDLVLGSALPAAPAVLVVVVGATLGVASAWFAVREAR